MFLAFDIGGTNTRIAISSDDKTLDFKIIPTEKDFEAGLQSIKKVADELSGSQKIDAIAGGIAGPLDKAKSMLVKSPHVSGWVNKPLKHELEKIFNSPVSLENDTALVGLGEATSGAGVGKNIVAYITVSTGVGGVRIVNGKIDKNSLGFEPGHQIIIIDGKTCHCGGKGHFEAYVAGYYLERDFHQKGEDIKDPVIWDQITKYLAVGLNNAIVHWSPDILILGGAVMKSIDLEQVKKYLARYLTIFPNSPRIVRAKLGDQAGLFGALQILRLREV